MARPAKPVPVLVAGAGLIALLAGGGKLAGVAKIGTTFTTSTALTRSGGRTSADLATQLERYAEMLIPPGLPYSKQAEGGQ
ncbi:MAG: hypothetical protein ACRDZX_06245 [Acidimicrobiales bacterium]